MLIGVDEIGEGFQGGIEEFRGPNQGDGDEQDGPILGGELEPHPEDNHTRGDTRVNPGIALRAQDIPPALEGESD